MRTTTTKIPLQLPLYCLPKHVTPSPVYPWLQVQMKPPGVLVQAALVSQLLSPGEAHSFISSIIRISKHVCIWTWPWEGG